MRFSKEKQSRNFPFVSNQQQKAMCTRLSLIQPPSILKGGFLMTSSGSKIGFYSL